MSFFSYLDLIKPFKHSLTKHIPYGGYLISGKSTLYHKIHVHETNNGTIIYSKIPGIKKDGVKVTAVHDETMLALSGFSKREEDVKDGSLLVHERHFVSFDSNIKLPIGSDSDKTNAKFDNGLLTIIIFKRHKKSCSKIKI